jgi:hypothetical protein
MSTVRPGARSRLRPGGSVRMRRALALAGCGVLSVGLTACESTEQESSRIGRESAAATLAAERAEAHAHASKHHSSHGHSSTHHSGTGSSK